MKIINCLKCGPQPISNFSKNRTRRNGLQVWCKACKKRYNKSHYETNKEVYAKNTQEHQQALRSTINHLKESTPCKDCGKFYPSYVMDFDHVVGQKVFNLSKAHAYSKQEIDDELTKCEIVCANCHRERTHRRKSGIGCNGSTSVFQTVR